MSALRIPTSVSWGSDMCRIRIPTFLYESIGLEKGKATVGCWVWEDGRLYFEPGKPGEKSVSYQVRKETP